MLLISEGDESAFAVLFDHYYRILKPFVVKFAKSETDAEEILQETFIRIWLYRDNIQQIENLDGWIYRVASRECLSFFRKNRAGQPYFSDLDKYSHIRDHSACSPNESIQTEEMRMAISRFVEGMPQQRKRIFKLSREEGLKPSEIAAMLSLSVSTIKNTLSTTLREIRNHLIRLGFEPVLVFFCMLGLLALLKNNFAFH